MISITHLFSRASNGNCLTHGGACWPWRLPTIVLPR